MLSRNEGEGEPAILDTGFRSIYMHSNINGKSLDSPEFLPFFEKAGNYNLLIYIHQFR
jgi:hypothetical protein